MFLLFIFRTSSVRSGVSLNSPLELLMHWWSVRAQIGKLGESRWELIEGIWSLFAGRQAGVEKASWTQWTVGNSWAAPVYSSELQWTSEQWIVKKLFDALTYYPWQDSAVSPSCSQIKETIHVCCGVPENTDAIWSQFFCQRWILFKLEVKLKASMPHVASAKLWSSLQDNS